MKTKVFFLAILTAGYMAGSLAQPNSPHMSPSLQPDTAFIYLTNGNVGGFFHYIYNDKSQRIEEHYFESPSGKWVESLRRYYTYNSDGLLLDDLQQYYENGQWKNLYQNRFAYNSNNRLTMELYQEWADSLGRWYNKNIFYYTYNDAGKVDTFYRVEDDSNYIARIFYQYDAQGNQTLEQWQYMDTAWTDMFRATSQYNSKNQLVDYLEENWNHTHGGPPKLEWENWLHWHYTYDSIGDKKELQTWTWDCANERWNNERYFFYTHDSLHRCKEELLLRWDRGSLVWVKSEFTTFEYDGRNRLILSLKQTSYMDNWINNEQKAYVYDDSDRVVSQSNSFWNESEQKWDNSYWEVWDYDPEGNLLENTCYNWDNAKNDWIGVYRTLCSFDENGNGDTTRYEMYDKRKGWYPFDHMLSVYYNRHTDSIGSFHTSKVSVHYRLYPPDSTAMATVSTPELRCYPNPVKEQLIIDTQEGLQICRYQLWNANGQLIIDKQVGKNMIVIPMNQLPDGYYLIRCQTDKGILVRSVVKQ